MHGIPICLATRIRMVLEGPGFSLSRANSCVRLIAFMEIFFPVSDSVCSPVVFKDVHQWPPGTLPTWSGCVGHCLAFAFEGSAPTIGADFVPSLRHIRAVPSSAWLHCFLSNSIPRWCRVQKCLTSTAGGWHCDDPLVTLHEAGVPPDPAPLHWEMMHDVLLNTKKMVQVFP